MSCNGYELRATTKSQDLCVIHPLAFVTVVGVYMNLLLKKYEKSILFIGLCVNKPKLVCEQAFSANRIECICYVGRCLNCALI